MASDGSGLAFSHQCWGTVRSELMELIVLFQDTRRSSNAFFVTTMPKKEGATSIKDFRHISVVGSIYKIIFKALSNRQKK